MDAFRTNLHYRNKERKCNIQTSKPLSNGFIPFGYLLRGSHIQTRKLSFFHRRILNHKPQTFLILKLFHLPIKRESLPLAKLQKFFSKTSNFFHKIDFWGEIKKIFIQVQTLTFSPYLKRRKSELSQTTNHISVYLKRRKEVERQTSNYFPQTDKYENTHSLFPIDVVENLRTFHFFVRERGVHTHSSN